MIRRIISTGLAIALTAAMAVSLASCGTETVDLNRYLVFTTEGYDGCGTASYTINTRQLIRDFTGRISLTAEGRKDKLVSTVVHDGTDPVKLLADALSGTLSTQSGLSNGDIVTFTWDIDSSILTCLDINVECCDRKFTVRNLEETIEYDAFEGVTVSFSGLSSEGEAVLTVPDNLPLDESAYTMPGSEGLSNGDTVTVCIDNDAVQNVIQDTGMTPAETSKDFIVEGLGYYVTELSQIPADDLMKAADYIASDYMDTKNKEWESEYIWPVSGTLFEAFGRDRLMDSVDYLGSYLYVSADSLSNDLYFVYRVGVQQLDYSSGEEEYVWVPVEYYWLAECPDIIIRDDGSCKLNYTQYVSPTTVEASVSITQNQVLPETDTILLGSVAYAGFKHPDLLEQYLEDVQEGCLCGSSVDLTKYSETTDVPEPNGEETDDIEAADDT